MVYVLGCDPGFSTCSFVGFEINRKTLKFKVLFVIKLNFLSLRECCFTDKNGIKCGKVAHWASGRKLYSQSYCASHKYKINGEIVQKIQTSYEKKPVHEILTKLKNALIDTFPNPKFDHVFIEDIKKISRRVRGIMQKKWNNTMKEIVNFIRAYFMITNNPPIKRKEFDIFIVNPTIKFQIRAMPTKLDYIKRKKALSEIMLNMMKDISPEIVEHHFSKIKKIDDPIDAFAIAFISILKLYEHKINVKKASKVLKHVFLTCWE